MSFRLALPLLLCGALAGQPALKPGRKYTTVERLAPERLAAVASARQAFAKERKPGPPVGIYQDFPALLHSHAEDAPHTLGKRAEVLAAAKLTGARVVMFSDHGGPKPDTWHGLRDGILFIPGAEIGAKHELSYPGLRFHSHPEGQMDASPDGWDGMEIYNRHADAEDDTDLLAWLKSTLQSPEKTKELAALLRLYPDEIFGSGCDYWPDIFARWDSILAKRNFTGIAANDAHQNQVFADGQIVIDPYPVAFRNTVTHILAPELSEKAITESLKAGRAYVSHDWLCDPQGFSFIAVNNLGVYEMGDTIPMAGTTRVVARSPIPALWKIFHNGKIILEKKDLQVTADGKEPGAYRAEAWLEVDGELRPWIYSNAVRLERPNLLTMALPSQTLDENVTADKDLTYQNGSEDAVSKHKLDIFRSKSVKNAPVLFFVHGGAWRSGDRSQYPFFGNLFAKAGYVVVVPSYRLAPKDPHPAQIEDVAAAFAWTVKNVASYGGDPSKIIIAGHSAGGHLVSLLATNEAWLDKHGLSVKNIRGVIALSGVYDVTSMGGPVFPKEPGLLIAASPLKNIKPGRPPFLVGYCQWDYASLPQQAIEFHTALRQAGLRSTLVYVPGENHISEMTNIGKSTDLTASAMLQFLEALR